MWLSKWKTLCEVVLHFISSLSGAHRALAGLWPEGHAGRVTCAPENDSGRLVGETPGDTLWFRVFFAQRVLMLAKTGWGTNNARRTVFQQER